MENPLTPEQIHALIRESLAPTLEALEKQVSEQSLSLTSLHEENKSVRLLAEKLEKHLNNLMLLNKATQEKQKSEEKIPKKSQDDMSIKKENPKGMSKNASEAQFNSKKKDDKKIPEKKNNMTIIKEKEEKKKEEKPTSEKKPEKKIEKKPEKTEKPKKEEKEKKDEKNGEKKEAKEKKNAEKKEDKIEKKPEKPEKTEKTEKKPEKKEKNNVEKKEDKKDEKKPVTAPTIKEKKEVPTKKDEKKEPKKEEKEVKKEEKPKKEVKKEEKEKKEEKKKDTTPKNGKNPKNSIIKIEKEEKTIQGKKKDKKEEEKESTNKLNDEKKAETSDEKKVESISAPQNPPQNPSQDPPQNPPENVPLQNDQKLEIYEKLVEKKEEILEKPVEKQEEIQEKPKEEQKEPQKEEEKLSEPEIHSNVALEEKKEEKPQVNPKAQKYEMIITELNGLEKKEGNPYEYPLVLSESTEGAINLIDTAFENEFLLKPVFEPEILWLFQALFIIEDISLKKNISDETLETKIREYMEKYDGSIKNHLFELSNSLNLDTKRKIKLEKLCKIHPCILSTASYDTKDALSSVIAFLLFDICNYFGVIDENIDTIANSEPNDLGISKPNLERIFLWRSEKLDYYKLKLEKC